MPVTNLRQIERFPQLSGKPLPPPVPARLEARRRLRPPCGAAGVEIATELSAQLLEGGAPGLHFYTLNRSTATLEVFADLGLAARR